MKTGSRIGCGRAAEVHTLGTKTWKDVDFSDRLVSGLCPTYLNGFVYWRYFVQTYCAVSFDIENECFGLISTPLMDSMSYNEVIVGSLGGELSLSCCFTSGDVGVWVLRDYGTTKAWHKVLSIQSDSVERWPCGFGAPKPIKFLNDGALLMFHSYTNSLIYTHPKKLRFRYFKMSGTSADLEVTAHIPSFVSLKDALSGHNVKVFKTRCAELKLQHEGARFSVLEKDIQGLLTR